MANKTNSLSRTKWMCKYHIVFIPKYRRKAIYGQYRADLQEIIKLLCKYKGVEIIEGHMMPDHIHLLLSIPPNFINVTRKTYAKVFLHHSNKKVAFLGKAAGWWYLPPFGSTCILSQKTSPVP